MAVSLMFKSLAHAVLFYCSDLNSFLLLLFLLIYYAFGSPILTSALIFCYLFESILHISVHPAFCSTPNPLCCLFGISLLNFVFAHYVHLRRSQFLMNCWLGSLVTRQPSAQWLPLNHAGANSTVQLDYASHCHHPGGRVLGMLGRVTPPACASSAVSLVGSMLEMIKYRSL